MTIVPAVILIPVTVAAGPTAVEERLLIVFVLMFTTGEILALAKAITAPPAPEEIKVLIALLETEREEARPLAPMFNPVIAAVPEIVEIVLLEIEEVPPNPLIFITVTAEVPPVQLLKVLALTALVAGPASVFIHPAMIVAPVTVMLEKLLLLL